MRSFISAVALLVKVTASTWRKAVGSSVFSRSSMYEAASVNVLPEPAEAAYTVMSLFFMCANVQFFQHPRNVVYPFKISHGDSRHGEE